MSLLTLILVIAALVAGILGLAAVPSRISWSALGVTLLAAAVLLFRWGG